MEENRKNTLCIGITGGLSSGKTTVAKIIEEQGYPAIYTDDLAKELMHNNERIKKRIIKNFGDNTYNQDGTLNNEFLAEIVFADTEESYENLQKLNVIVHPSVISEMMRLVDEYEKKGKKLVFVESALIYEMGLDEGFNYVMSVYTDEEIMIKRAVERGLTSEQIQHRLREQLSAKQKQDWAEFSINNNGSLNELKEATLSLLDILKEL
jgi:dephospho-CoA kinase